MGRSWQWPRWEIMGNWKPESLWFVQPAWSLSPGNARGRRLQMTTRRSGNFPPAGCCYFGQIKMQECDIHRRVCLFLSELTGVILNHPYQNVLDFNFLKIVTNDYNIVVSSIQYHTGKEGNSWYFLFLCAWGRWNRVFTIRMFFKTYVLNKIRLLIWGRIT